MPCTWCSQGGYWECGAGRPCGEAEEMALEEMALAAKGEPGRTQPPRDWTYIGPVTIEDGVLYYVKAAQTCRDARVERDPGELPGWEVVGTLTGGGFGLPPGRYSIYCAKRPKGGPKCHVFVVPGSMISA
jgi:hypothetical protein